MRTGWKTRSSAIPADPEQELAREAADPIRRQTRSQQTSGARFPFVIFSCWRDHSCRGRSWRSHLDVLQWALSAYLLLFDERKEKRSLVRDLRKTLSKFVNCNIGGEEMTKYYLAQKSFQHVNCWSCRPRKFLARICPHSLGLLFLFPSQI